MTLLFSSRALVENILFGRSAMRIVPMSFHLDSNLENGRRPSSILSIHDLDTRRLPRLHLASRLTFYDPVGSHKRKLFGGYTPYIATLIIPLGRTV
jgi:hypothetical protein